MLVKHSDWTILVDDYQSRIRYHVLENFLKLEGVIGGMAVFRKNPLIQTAELDIAIREYELLALD